MQWVLWMIAVAVLGLAAVAASGRLGELPGTVTDTPRPHVPTGVLSGDDLRGLRFAVVPRGYSMDQVDELLDRLARQLDKAARPAPAAWPVTESDPAPTASPWAEPGPAPTAHPVTGQYSDERALERWFGDGAPVEDGSDEDSNQPGAGVWNNERE